PEIIAYVSKKSFRPSPKVDSAIIKIAVKKPKDLPKIDSELFFKIVKAGFAGKRKQLINTLSRGLDKTKERVKDVLEQAMIQPERRAESLSLEEWVALVKKNS
ncbi:TPA: 16S rRNA (adenine(1518)-N(6)/adenine(1519)-N(6))-dimethyltransferase, partial [Candidatus Azambacteria bacterium]|nr:16S rRNA (adenine(1518)-N(6)/adenine(1519)-N(6))-dimethyltransferase [Candidatus Azambacteria bacterium]